jgi:hypothetical protein
MTVTGSKPTPTTLNHNRFMWDGFGDVSDPNQLDASKPIVFRVCGVDIALE